MKEDAVLFGKTKSLVGIITEPSPGSSAKGLPAFIILNSGIAHRVGTSCLYVKLARRLAASGFTAFRFDFSGVGDSKVRTDTLMFDKSAESETQEAMDFLYAERGIRRFILTGICRGSEVAFSTACRDARVVGAVFMNHPFYYGEEFHTYVRERNNARFFWKHALFNPRQWSRAIRGRLNYRRVVTAIGFPLQAMLRRKQELPERASDDVAHLSSLVQRGVQLLLVYAENDAGLDSLQIVFGDHLEQFRSTESVDLAVISESDHTFTLLQNQHHLFEVIDKWAHKIERWTLQDEAAPIKQ